MVFIALYPDRDEKVRLCPVCNEKVRLCPVRNEKVKNYCSSIPDKLPYPLLDPNKTFRIQDQRYVSSNQEKW